MNVIMELNARIEELEAKLLHYEADAIHTCHDYCKRAECVTRRKLAKAVEALEEVRQTFHDPGEWPGDGHIKAINIAVRTLAEIRGEGK
jgi:hypothetical protein